MAARDAQGGRGGAEARTAGRIPRRLYAEASTPVEGLPGYAHRVRERRRAVRPLAGRMVGPRPCAVRAAVHGLVPLRGPARPPSRCAAPRAARRARPAPVGCVPRRAPRALRRAPGRRRPVRRRAGARARHPPAAAGRARRPRGERARLPGASSWASSSDGRCAACARSSTSTTSACSSGCCRVRGSLSSKALLALRGYGLGRSPALGARPPAIARSAAPSAVGWRMSRMSPNAHAGARGVHRRRERRRERSARLDGAGGGRPARRVGAPARAAFRRSVGVSPNGCCSASAGRRRRSASTPTARPTPPPALERGTSTRPHHQRLPAAVGRSPGRYANDATSGG